MAKANLLFGKYEIIPMKVRLPFGEAYSVDTIAGNVEHIGNRVAEGDIHPSMFWPKLARLERRQRLAVERRSLERRERDAAVIQDLRDRLRAANAELAQ